MTPASFRLDVALWGCNLDHPATPAYRFLPQGQVAHLARRLREALGREGRRPGALQEAAEVLLGRRVTTLKRVRVFEYALLKEHLDAQTEDNPLSVYGEKESL